MLQLKAREKQRIHQKNKTFELKKKKTCCADPLLPKPLYPKHGYGANMAVSFGWARLAGHIKLYHQPERADPLSWCSSVIRSSYFLSFFTFVTPCFHGNGSSAGENVAAVAGDAQHVGRNIPDTVKARSNRKAQPFFFLERLAKQVTTTCLTGTVQQSHHTSNIKQPK